MSHSKQDILNQINAMKTWRIEAETAATGKGFSDVSTAHDISTFASEFGGCYPGPAAIMNGGTLFYAVTGNTVNVPVTVHAKEGKIVAQNNMSINSSSTGPGEYTLTASSASHTPVFSGAPSFGGLEFRTANNTGLDTFMPRWVVVPGV